MLYFDTPSFNELDSYLIFEQSFNIDSKKGSNLKILIRSAQEGAYGNTISQHAPTVKIINKTRMKPIVVPMTSINEIDHADFYADVNTYKNDVREYIKSFIYSNQMYILAIWFNLDSVVNRQLQKLLEEKVKEDTKNKLYQKKLKPKTRDELEKDKEEIIKYVRNKLKDDKVIISFNSYTK